MLKDNFRNIEPYVPGEQPQSHNKIKLNTNENPYPPSPKVRSALMEFDSESLKLYPDPNMEEIRETLAKFHGVNKENVFAGAGSDDVLAMCFMAFFNSGKPVLFPDITYAFYAVWANLFKIPYEKQPLSGGFEITAEDYFKSSGGIVFPNPNAPTGLVTGLYDIERILEHNRDTVVIIDEAYIDFGGDSALPLIDKYDNLVVTRTFSKSRSLAGIRLGYAISNPMLINELNAVKNSYNSYTLSNLTMKLASASVADDSYFSETVQKIVDTREKYKVKLAELGFEFPDSKANFIFARHKKYRAEDIFEALRSNNIFVRHFKSERIDNYLRITVGTEEEMEELTAFLTRYIEKGGAV